MALKQDLKKLAGGNKKHSSHGVSMGKKTPKSPHDIAGAKRRAHAKKYYKDVGD